MEASWISLRSPLKGLPTPHRPLRRIQPANLVVERRSPFGFSLAAAVFTQVFPSPKKCSKDNLQLGVFTVHAAGDWWRFRSESKTLDEGTPPVEAPVEKASASEAKEYPVHSGTRYCPARLVHVWSGLSAIALLLATLRLWFPPALVGSFPQVPLHSFFLGWPIAVDWGLACLLCVGWGLVIVGRLRLGSALVVLSGLVLVGLNQHRLQPWHYQLMLFAAVFLFARRRDQRPLLRWLTISVYFYSAISKADFEFLHTVGQQFLESILQVIALGSEISPRAKLLLTGLFPGIEVLIAIGLTHPRFQRVAGWSACLLHLGLMLLLGPLGLDHSLGVVLWNLYFAVLAWLLFVKRDPPRDEKQPPETERGVPRWILACGLVPVFLLPLVERWGYWDHWTSWALYAPHSSRAEIFVATTAHERLPEGLQAMMPVVDVGSLWQRVPAGRWSLSSVSAPVYPQDRFQLGVARYLAHQLDSEFEIRVDILGPASRWSGQRTRTRFEGISAIDRAGDQFWWNSQPREQGDERGR